VADECAALLTALVTATRQDRSPGEVLAELLAGLVAAVGAESGSIAVYDDSTGRVVAATPGSAWALGRPVDRSAPVFQRLVGGDCLDLDVATEVPADLADQLLARGLCRAAAVGIVVHGRLAGTIQVYFRDLGGRLSQSARDAMRIAARLADRFSPIRGDVGLAAALADGLAVLDAHGLVRAWNPAAQLLTGIAPAAALGRPMPFPVPEVGQGLEHELPNGQWIQVLSAELAGSDERVVTFRDSTQVHRREQAKDLFVATASHELRTPVTVIRGFAETLDLRWERLTEPERREAVRKLRDQAERLAVLIDRLLLVGDQERVDALLSPIEFDLLTALRTAADKLGVDEPHRLVVDLPPALPAALGDEGSVRTVLSELVRNARKYSPDGGEITVTAGADERTVYFRVADHGVGLPPEDVEHAFERFWQAEGTDRRRFGGVGLGLYLVRRMVEGQHGWVSLRRRIPDGTVAEVRLPRADVT